MKYMPRSIQPDIQHHLERGKSILLLGPRQTGKSTILSRFEPHMVISFLQAKVRQRYEREPSILEGEIEALNKQIDGLPLVVIDEVQKVPQVTDTIQHCIDHKIAQFIITGSSARKLKRSGAINLLPGRVVSLRLDPFTLEEWSRSTLDELLLDGTLPGIIQISDASDREIDLQSYVETYLEEEVRTEALVRKMGSFIRFLEYAGLESGKIANFHKLSQEIGVNHTTIASYYEILEDCLVAERIDPLTKSTTRKKLTKSSRYLIFDMGVRRLCANEGRKPGNTRMGELFEQYVGLELVRYARQSKSKVNIKFWRDPDGPEVDWIIETQNEIIPIEVKWTELPKESDAKHLKVFLKEYKEAKRGYIICRTPNSVSMTKNITALSWRELRSLF